MRRKRTWESGVMEPFDRGGIDWTKRRQLAQERELWIRLYKRKSHNVYSRRGWLSN